MNALFQNRKILITAGPTREAIDPVRYVSNHSSGKMGYAIAKALLDKGATVFMVSGPVSIELKHKNLKIIRVNSATEMYLACCHFFEEVDAAIFAAAVADYRPEKISENKIKKECDAFTIKMVKNIDTAYEFGKIKSRNQFSVGFALETNEEIKHAAEKLRKKNFDMVILNSMNDAQATFGYDTNKITIIKSDFTCTEYSLKSKTEVAEDIVFELSSALQALEHYQPEVVSEFESMYAQILSA